MRPLRIFLLALSVLAAPPAWATLQAPTVALSPASVAAGTNSTVTITLDNNPPGNPNDITFTEVYPANVVNSATPGEATICTNGVVTATGLGNSISLSGASISGNNSCTVTVSVTACIAGSYSIGGFAVTSTSGNPTAGSATLTVVGNSPGDAALSSVSAAPASVPADGTNSAAVTVTLRSLCGTPIAGKTITLGQGAGSSSITPASAVTNASGVATFTVTTTTPETVTYTATDVTDSVVLAQTATVTFFPPPVVAKSFSPSSIIAGQSSTLSVMVTNLNTFAIAGLAFTDSYPANLVNAAVPGLVNSCGGAASAVAGGTQLTLNGGAIPAASSCTVSVSVTSAVAGSYNNGTGTVTSTNVGNGAPTFAVLDVAAAVSSFNVVEPGGDAVAGRIFTKIAGQDIAVDIVARDASNMVAAGFTGTVAVELVDNTSGGACAGLPLIKALADQTFTGGDAGRHPLSAGQFEANAWRNVLFRVKFPVAAPTVTSCSSDAFANRPLQFASVLVRDQDRVTAGTTRTLNNTSNPGIGTVHNAGRPFRIDATAQNGAGAPATTTLYGPDAGQPVAILAQCGAGAVCPATPGALSLGAWSVAAGVITTTTATYADVGAFNLTLQDQTFASVDAGDGTATSVRYISSATLTVGRFVPDHFTLAAGASITPRTDIAACAGSSFTYMDERMDLVFALTAREAGGAVTPGYTGAILGALVLNSAASYNFGAIDSTAPTLLTARLDVTLIAGIASSWSAGAASITAPLSVLRDTAPDGPYGSLLLGIAPTDPDGVALRGADLNLDADNSGTPERAQVGAASAVRFGQLRMQNAYGSGKTVLPVPIVLQYWRTLPAPAAFVTNADDSCTTLNRANIGLSAYEPYSSSPPATRDQFLQPCETAVTQATVSFASGVGSLTMASPDTASADTDNGKVLLTAHLRALTTPPPICPAAGSVCYCPGVGAAEADATTANKSYLLGRWDDSADPDGDASTTYDDNPSATATFGLFGSQPKNFIFFRENY